MNNNVISYEIELESIFPTEYIKRKFINFIIY